MILDCLEKVLRQETLTEEEAAAALAEILSGEASPVQASALLVALAMRGESEAELLGMARVLRGQTRLVSQYGPAEVGLCHSERKLLLPQLLSGVAAAGEVGPAPFDIFSAVAFVVAGAGVHVLAQSWRSANSDLESAGVLEALGIRTQIPAGQIARGVVEVGLGFVLEPLVREAMSCFHFADREVPVPTAFHLLLPLLNPGGAPALVVGVYSARMTETVARVVARLGVRRAFVFHGSDGLDVISNTGPTTLIEIENGQTNVRRIEPGDFGLPVGRLDELTGGDASQCAAVIRSILQGAAGPRRQVVLLNAAPAIVCGGKDRDLAEGVQKAAAAIDSGRALQALQNLARFTHQTS